MLILKHLKTLQHDSIFIQIIFRELIGSLLKSLNWKITEFKNCGDAAPAASPQWLKASNGLLNQSMVS